MTDKNKAIRYNNGKSRFDLTHAKAMQGLVDVLTVGAVKYAPRNWEKGFNWSSVIASLKRHLQAFEAGEDYDPETGLKHIDHVQANAHFISAFYDIYPEGDDRETHWFRKPLKRIFCDLDGVLVDFETHFLTYLGLPKDHPTDWDDFRFRENFSKIKDDENFWITAPRLIEPSDIKYPIQGYVTSRPISNEVTRLWLQQNGFPDKTLINVGANTSKVEALLAEKCDVFVDDYIVNFIECQNKGILCYLMTRPHNEKYDVGHFRVNNFQEFLKKL